MAKKDDIKNGMNISLEDGNIIVLNEGISLGEKEEVKAEEQTVEETVPVEVAADQTPTSIESEVSNIVNFPGVTETPVIPTVDEVVVPSFEVPTVDQTIYPTINNESTPDNYELNNSSLNNDNYSADVYQNDFNDVANSSDVKVKDTIATADDLESLKAATKNGLNNVIESAFGPVKDSIELNERANELFDRVYKGEQSGDLFKKIDDWRRDYKGLAKENNFSDDEPTYNQNNSFVA